MAAFRDAFHEQLGSLVEEVVVGAGPCGELRWAAGALLFGVVLTFRVYRVARQIKMFTILLQQQCLQL
jgi:hypothetical protein